MNRLSETRNQVIRWTLIGGFGIIILALIFVRTDKMPLVLGVLFGVSISVLNFLELEKTLIKASKMKPAQAQSYATKKYFLRYAISGVVILVSIKASYISVMGTIIGLLLLKFVVIITNLFNDKEYFRRIFRKEE